MKHNNDQHIHLVVIRISDSSAMSDLNKKTVETADLHRDIPGADVLRKLRGSPLRDPGKVNGRVTTASGFRAVHFRLPGTKTYVLMALGSATMANLGEDDNAFVTLLSDVLAETRASVVWVADFSRLVRSIDYFSDTWRAVREHCDFVRHGAAEIDTSSPSAEIQFLFEALSSAADARSVIQRTTRGKMRTYVDGKCPLRNQSVPLGWTRDKQRRLQLDPSVPPEVIREIVQVLGDPGLSNQERVERVADAGGISRTRSRQLGRDVRVDELNNPAATVRRWYDLLDIWRTGTWVVEYSLPALLNQSRFDFDVTIEPDGRGTKVWRMEFHLPAPQQSWATEEEFEAAAGMRDRRAEHGTPQGGAAAGTDRKPFCGLPAWLHDGHEYKLLSRGAGAYELRRRPEERATRSEVIGGRRRRVQRGWGRGRKDGSVVGHFSAMELHRTIAEGLVEAAVDGLTLQSASDQLLPQDDGIVDDLKVKRRKARTRARNARRSANEATSEPERRAYQDDARKATRQAQDFERDLLAFAGTGHDHELPVDAETVAFALAAVADQPDHVEGCVADALREVITGLQITPVDETTAEWSASLRVPLVGGVMTIGPATGSLDLGLARRLAARRTKTLPQRADEATRLFMADGLSISAVSEHLRIATTRRVAQTIRDHLQHIGATAAAARALVAWTPPAGRRVVWSRLTDTPFPTDVPQAYAAHVAEVYLQGDVRQDASIEWHSRMPRAAVSAVLDRGGWVAEDDLDALCRQAEISPTTLLYYVDGRVRHGRHFPTYLRRFDGGVGVIPCPHCDDGWATTVSLLPEVTRELLCDNCGRMPDTAAKAIVFPDEYLRAPT